ncbi:MAG: outer membrane beta-barrel protein [Candidatus Krumholzibacteriia bacterium]
MMMRSALGIWVLVVLLTAPVAAGSAETDREIGWDRFEVGVVAGLSRGHYRGDIESERDEGVAAGLVAKLRTSRWFSVGAELLYVDKRAAHVHTGTWYAFESGQWLDVYSRARFQWLEVPLLFRFVSPPGTYLVIGASTSILLDHSDEYEEDYPWDDLAAGWGSNVGGRYTILDRPPDVDSAAIVGVGQEIQVGNGTVALEVRYHRGLRDLNKASSLELHIDALLATIAVTY